MALKQYKPTSPGQRGLVLVDKSSLSKDRPIKKLTEIIYKIWAEKRKKKY